MIYTSRQACAQGERMNTRRRFVIALGASALAAPLTPFAQQQRVYRVGTLTTASAATAGHLFDAFIQGLPELGYVEGKNILIERRFAEGNVDRLPALAADLVQLKVDVIFAPNTPSVQAAKQVAGTIPIVFAVTGAQSRVALLQASPGRAATSREHRSSHQS